MRRDIGIVVLSMVVVLLAGCRAMDRLSFIRPSAERGEFRQVAPDRDVSGKPGKRSADPVQLLQSAVDAYRLGDFVRAESLAKASLQAGAPAGDANTLLGVVADARGQREAAGGYYRAAASAAPGNGTYANNYGGWLCATGQAGASLEWFDRAVADPTYPTPANAAANAGDCAAKAGLAARAEASWRLALATQPTHVQALAGMAALEAGRGRHLEARAFLERWLELNPNDLAALRLAAQVEDALGDNEAAARYRMRLQAASSATQRALPTP